MKKINRSLQLVFTAIFIVCVVGFVRLFIDSADIDYIMGRRISRSRVLNQLLLFYIFPFIIVVFSIWIHQVVNCLKRFRKDDRYAKSLKYYNPLFWWIPFFHFMGSLNSMKVIINDAESAQEEKELTRLRSGIRWINTGFILFYSLVLIAFTFDFFNNNKDSHDFFLNMLYLHVIVLLIGGIKISRSLQTIKGLED